MSAEVPGEVVAPAADPQAIRACLSPAMVAEFDVEWDVTLDEAKREKDLTPVHWLLNKWRHVAYAEMKDPGAHLRMLARAEQIMGSGEISGSAPVSEVRALIERKLARQVYRLVHTPEALDQLDALPPPALAPYAEILSFLELTPWNGEPQNKANLDGAVRRMAFGPGGAGQVVYLVVDRSLEVHVLMIQWIG